MSNHLVNNFKDRVPTQMLSNGAIRYEQFNSSGTSLGYIYIKRADEPTEVGNAWNKAIYDGIKAEFGDVLYSASKATQAQAEAGTNNTNYMTPLRVLQEINEKALPSKQMSIKTGTVNNGGTIPQTAGFTHYMYFVSINSIEEIESYSTYSTQKNYISLECSVDQTTREVTCEARYMNDFDDRWHTVGGTANYIEIAYN